MLQSFFPGDRISEIHESVFGELGKGLPRREKIGAGRFVSGQAGQFPHRGAIVKAQGPGFVEHFGAGELPDEVEAFV